jgi:uncharacterized protein (TIGR02145 family)
LNFFFRLFLSVFVIFLSYPFVCHATTIILSHAYPNHIVTADSDEKVYGTSAPNQITLESDARAELIHFPGNNSILIQSRSDVFSVYRSGTTIIYEGSDGTVLKIPATADIQTITFLDKTSTLRIHVHTVMMDDQEITTTAQPIENTGTVCGAYVAPGVWKEFDCYNLAAIGKTTNDDPFTPSWRLNGGYWQWGRKGPDSSQWYDTNTLNFAHGPTGPDAGEANSGRIDIWGEITEAPDGAWSDSDKTANDPCPAGFRVPSKSQWQGVLDNNVQIPVGTWGSGENPVYLFDITNYSCANFFGSDLMLPAAGVRYTSPTGVLFSRGFGGYYWSSSVNSAENCAWFLCAGYHLGPFGSMSEYLKGRGLSVRCVAELLLEVE